MKRFAIVFALSLTCLTIGQSIPSQDAKLFAEYLPLVKDNPAPLVANQPLKYRQRRESPSVEYLPPVAVPPSAEYLPPEGAETRTADVGYRYKTVRRLRFRARHRRDVSELNAAPSVEYLPPVPVELAPDLRTLFANDGYRYKAVRRLKFRRHRREAEAAVEAAVVDIPSDGYLPPSDNNAQEPAVKSADLAQDGYRYKTVRRFRYRYRL